MNTKTDITCSYPFMNPKSQRLRRLPFILISILALLAGIWSGLIRLGWAWPSINPALPMDHGPLMVAGFLGTLIALERSVALGVHGQWRVEEAGVPAAVAVRYWRLVASGRGATLGGSTVDVLGQRRVGVDAAENLPAASGTALGCYHAWSGAAGDGKPTLAVRRSLCRTLCCGGPVSSS